MYQPQGWLGGNVPTSNQVMLVRTTLTVNAGHWQVATPLIGAGATEKFLKQAIAQAAPATTETGSTAKKMLLLFNSKFNKDE